jgi:hypothetical protein
MVLQCWEDQLRINVHQLAAQDFTV